MSACAGTPVAEAVPAGHTQWCDDGTRRVYFERRGSEGPAFPSTTPRALRKQRKRLPERGIISGATMTPPASKRAPQAAIDGRVSGPVPVQRSGRSGRGRVARSAAAHTFRYSTSQQGASGARAPANQGGGRAHIAAPAASGRATRAPAGARTGARTNNRPTETSRGAPPCVFVEPVAK